MPYVRRKKRNQERKKWFFLAVASIILVVVCWIGYKINYSNTTIVSENEPILKNESSILPTEKPDNIESKIFINKKANLIEIYVNADEDEGMGSNFAKYEVFHAKKELDRSISSSNYDVWNMGKVAKVQRNKLGNFSYVSDVVTDGEWDIAIKEKGATDFVGGTMHGDEIISEVSMNVNGERVNPEQVLSNYVSEFTLYSTTQLYRDNTLTTSDVEKIASRSKEYKFTQDGLTITQSIVFETDLSLDRSYLAMLPILRNFEDAQVTDTVTWDAAHEPVDVSKSGFKTTIVETDKVVISGETSGVKATVEVINKSTDAPTEFFVANDERYNKLYFSYVGDNYDVKKGDQWSQIVKYKISFE